MSAFRSFFFFNDTATTEIYTLSLHDALPIWPIVAGIFVATLVNHALAGAVGAWITSYRSEEHTSELQSPCNLVCRLLLEKKKMTCKRQQHLLNALVGEASIITYDVAPLDVLA